MAKRFAKGVDRIRFDLKREMARKPMTIRQTFPRGKNLIGVVEHELTGVGEHQVAPAAAKQFLTERFFKKAQLCAN